MQRRLTAAGTLAATLLLGACTSNAPQPPPPPGSFPEGPSDSPAVGTTSPTPSADQASADRAAIATSYREWFEEFNRLEMRGGATRLTPVLLDTTSGPHRANLLQWLKDDKKEGVRQVNPAALVGVSVGTGTATSRRLTACEDYSRVKWKKRDGTALKVDESTLKTVQKAVAKKGKDGRWRIDSTAETAVPKFESSVCGGSM